MDDFLTVGEAGKEIASQLGLSEAVPAWRIARLYDRGELPEVPKFCGARVIVRSQLPAIVTALANHRGWLPKPAEARHA